MFSVILVGKHEFHQVPKKRNPVPKHNNTLCATLSGSISSLLSSAPGLSNLRQNYCGCRWFTVSPMSGPVLLLALPAAVFGCLASGTLIHRAPALSFAGHFKDQQKFFLTGIGSTDACARQACSHPHISRTAADPLASTSRSFGMARSKNLMATSVRPAAWIKACFKTPLRCKIGWATHLSSHAQTSVMFS